MNGDVFSKTFAYSCHGISCFGKGLLEDSLEHLSTGLEFSTKLNHQWWQPWTHHFIAEVYMDKGKFNKAREHYFNAVSLFEMNRYWPSSAIASKMGLARAKILNGEKDLNIENLYHYASTAKGKLYLGLVRRYLCEILLNLNEERVPEAETWIKKAIQADDSNGVLFELGRDYACYAEILKRKGDRSSAEETFKRALNVFRKIGAEGWVKKV